MAQTTINASPDHFDDSLSFSDLSFHDQPLDQPNPPHSNSQQDLFEFSVSNSHSFPDNFVFCGNLIPHKTHHTKFDCSDPITRSSLHPLSSAVNHGNRSKSLQVKDSKPSLVSRSLRQQSSGKHKALIGLAKIPTIMELSDIKKRQSRWAEKVVSVPPAAAEEKKRMLAGVGDFEGNLVKPFRCRDFFIRALAGCLPFAKRSFP